jgi:hypothetical protein
MSSVLRQWVMELPLREQGGLLVALRGCDLTPKYPLDSLERKLVAAIRYDVMNPADSREVDFPGAFMVSRPPGREEFKLSKFGHYPQHWVMHIVHAIEILGYRHPDLDTREHWRWLYYQSCHSLHMLPEPFDTFVNRCSEDRIANNTVVS